MADLSQTAANVAIAGIADSNPGDVIKVRVGEAVSQGMPGYLKSDGKYWQTDANTQTEAAAKGIFLTPAAINGWATFALQGTELDLGGTLVVGTTYYVSVTKGAIADAAPVSTAWPTILGIAKTDSLMPLKITIGEAVTP